MAESHTKIALNHCAMKVSLAWLATLALTTATAVAQFVTLEPDDFSNAAVLNHVFPQVSLVTAGENNLPIPFNVTASDDGFGYAATGTRVFGHAGGIPFWNSFRRLRMDFAQPISSLAIDFIGGWTFTNDIGKLDVFNSAGLLLDSYTTAPRPADSVETMSLIRPAGDIAWAVAYLPADGGDFGRLDNLRFLVVPEPAGAGLLLLGAGGMACCRRKLNLVTTFLRRRPWVSSWWP